MRESQTPTDDEVRVWIRMYVEDGLSFLALSIEVERDQGTVRRHCIRLGLEPRPVGGPGTKGERTRLRDGVGPSAAIVQVPRSSGGHRRRRSW